MEYPVNKEEFVKKILKAIGNADDLDRKLASVIADRINEAYAKGWAAGWLAGTEGRNE